MKSIFKIFITIIVLSLIGWFTFSEYFYKKSEQELNQNVVPIENKTDTNSQVSEKIAAPEKAAIETKPIDNEETKKESREEKYRKEGYVDDPSDSTKLMKVIFDKKGRKKILYVDKANSGFEPVLRTIKNALETLDSRAFLNPKEEMTQLNRVDMNVQDNLMLMGHFRDKVNDLEIFISPVTDENGNLTEQDKVCFVSPKLKININGYENSGRFRADDTGYAVLKLNETQYARIMWSYEEGHKRTLHGQIWILQDSSYQKATDFTAQEVHISLDDAQKYCN